MLMLQSLSLCDGPLGSNISSLLNFSLLSSLQQSKLFVVGVGIGIIAIDDKVNFT